MPRPNWVPCATTDPKALTADDGTDDGPGNLTDLILRRFAGLRRAVPQHDVTQLVGQDAGHFALGARGLDHAAVDEHRPAGSANALTSRTLTA